MDFQLCIPSSHADQGPTILECTCKFQHFCNKILLLILYTVVGLCECVFIHILCVCGWSCEDAPDLRSSIDRYNSEWSPALPSSHVFSGNLPVASFYELYPPPGFLWPLALQASVDPSLCLLWPQSPCVLLTHWCPQMVRSAKPVYWSFIGMGKERILGQMARAVSFYLLAHLRKQKSQTQTETGLYLLL